jgi:hypothetical protein
MKREDFLNALTAFHGKASCATYAGNAGQAVSERQDFIELEYREGPWYYCDSYTGFLRSWGQEVIYYDNRAVWTNLYGGGMEPDCMRSDIAHETFVFLKASLSVGDKTRVFQPRGPESFSSGAWTYACSWQGQISGFSGDELISHQGKTLFRHRFQGGLVIGKSAEVF